MRETPGTEWLSSLHTGGAIESNGPSLQVRIERVAPADALTITTGSIDQINTLAHSTVVISV